MKKCNNIHVQKILNKIKKCIKINTENRKDNLDKMDFNFAKEPGKEKKIIKKSTNYIPLISIIMPFYNDLEYIEQSVISVLNQTFTDYELLIIDDGSTDKKSLEKLDEVGKLDERIKIFHKKNEGPSAARDYGASQSDKRAKYLFFLDADDLIVPTCLETYFWTLETNKDASWAYADCVGFGEYEYEWNKYFDSNLFKKDNFLVDTAMIRKEAFEEVGGYGLKEKQIYEDWNFWLKLLAKGRYPAKLSYYAMWYRRKKENSELQKSRANKKRALEIVKETASQIKGKVAAIQYPKPDYNWEEIVEDIETIPILKREKNNKINILMITPWAVMGGADKFNLDLIKGLDKDKFEITIILTEPVADNYRQEFEDYATIYDLTTFLNQRYWFAFINYIIKRNNVDIIFNTNSEIGYAFLPLIKAKYPYMPIIDYIHMEEWYNRNGGYSRDSSSVASVIDKTLTCNENSKKVFVDYFKRNSTEIQTVYIGVDEKAFDPEKYDKEKLKEKYEIPTDKTIVSYVCRITEQKRPMLLLQVISKLSQEQKNKLLFVIAGDGNQFYKMKEKANQLGLDNCIKFLGNITKTQEIYSISDITINCSIKEGLALASYESLSMGVPVISSDVGGQKELIDTNVGVIVPCMQKEEEIYNENYKEEEVNAYVDAIAKVTENLDKYKSNCRKRIIEKFTLNKMINDMTDIFEETVKNPNEEKIRNGEELSKQIGLCKELVLKTLLEMRDKYNWECMQFNQIYGVYNNKYNPKKQAFKDRMWKHAWYRGLIKMIKKTGIIEWLK